MKLQPGDFAAFFREIHDCDPFPWQIRLLETVSATGEWPRVLDLPTGSGKTAALDVAVFHLALEVGTGSDRRAAVRIAFVVDRRLIVDDAHRRASRIAEALEKPPGEMTARVAERFKALAGSGPPLHAKRLRGGIPRENDWARTPSQPTILCSTVDQIGSRLLFRGYGVTDAMKPVHAGLIGSDCLILLDEAHLAEPFRQTLERLEHYHSANWRQSSTAAPWGVALLTATPGTEEPAFGLTDDDRTHPVLARRLDGRKPAQLIRLDQTSEREGPGSSRDADHVDNRVAATVKQVRKALEHFRDPQNGVTAPAIGVIVNRIRRARAVLQSLRTELSDEIAEGLLDDPLLLIGAARPVDRDMLATRLLPIRTGVQQRVDRPLIIVATQCLEAGVDIDLDALITEAAPIDSLRQRFGRLNRAGRNINPYAAIMATRGELSTRYDDPVYGTAIREAWEHLLLRSTAGHAGVPCVDFGVLAFDAASRDHPLMRTVLAPRADAPVLMPAHVDLLSQTAPIPAADPDITLFLHGPDRQPDSVRVIWRADVAPAAQDTLRLLMLVPPRAEEAIELPLWEVRRWLTRDSRNEGVLADVPVSAPEDNRNATRDRNHRPAFRWAGAENSRWIQPNEVRPGDTIVVPTMEGGADEFGWAPASRNTVRDVAFDAARPFAGRRFAMRLTRDIIANVLLTNGTVDVDQTARANRADMLSEQLAERLGTVSPLSTSEVLERLLELNLPEEIANALQMLRHVKYRRIQVHLDVYGIDTSGRPRGVVLVAPLGLRTVSAEKDEMISATEDDVAGSLPGYSLPLNRHSADVADLASQYGSAAGLSSSIVADLRLAGRLHDLGKKDPRFQRWLWFGDVLGPDPTREDDVLAKSARRLPLTARGLSGLPDRWRHEALSVRLALRDEELARANDPALVLWLIGTHHGHGRPLFPHEDPTEAKSDVGPQSLAFAWQGLDWAMLFESLKARYGIWELARLETIIRLADHRASANAGAQDV